MKKAAAQRLKEAEAKASIVPQERLELDQSGGIMWKVADLSVRPNIALNARKKQTGTLIAVGNGFRYSTPDKSKVDITFKNIKHAIFQPPYKTSNSVYIHLQLHNPIMVGKKKSNVRAPEATDRPSRQSPEPAIGLIRCVRRSLCSLCVLHDRSGFSSITRSERWLTISNPNRVA
jgi:hypothetical protein